MFERLMLKSGAVLALAVVASLVACSTTETSKLKPPIFYSEDTLRQARQLIDEGYVLLDSANVEGAIDKFARVDQLVTNGLSGAYHTACAYARTGENEKAFKALSAMMDRGFDLTDQLSGDPDFDGLRSDPRFDSLVTRARGNYAKAGAAFASGMPEYATPPAKFNSEEELGAWADNQNRLIQTHGRYWKATDYIAARIDFAAQRLACLRELKKNDTTFDYGLERVRASARLQSAYQTGWGAVSDLVVKEVNDYLEGSSNPEKSSEANYQAGFALSMKFAEDDSQRTVAYQQAQGYLGKVSEGTAYSGAARGMLLVNQFRSPNANETELGGQLKNAIVSHPGDNNLYRVVSTQFANEAARYIWPIPLDKPDIDAKNVSLDEYRGKALLIDFWATWCGPCRAELPNLVAVYNEYHPKGLEVLSVSLDYPDDVTLDAYRTWIDSAGMSWRHVYDGGNWNTELARRFFVGSIPAPFLVGPDGALISWGEDLRGESLAPTVRTALGI